MGYSHPVSPSWRVIEQYVLRPLSEECKQMVVRAAGNPVADVIRFTDFQTLADMTVCDLFPAGLDFTCDGDESIRGLLYSETRNYVADELGLFYKAAPYRGTGIVWTAHGVIGEQWYDDDGLRKREAELVRGLQLSHAAIKIAPKEHKTYLKKKAAAKRSELALVKTRIYQIEQYQVKHDFLLPGNDKGNGRP